MNISLPFSSSLGAPPRLERLDHVSLFLDLDGTIAAIESRPSDVRSDNSRNALLSAVSNRLGGRLAVISGRTIEELDQILSYKIVPLAGVHGLERRRADGQRNDAPVHPGIAIARPIFKDIQLSDGGIILEDKGSSLALHYRCAPNAERIIKAAAMKLADETGLVLQRGAMVVELRAPGPNKADAISSFLNEPPFEASMPIFIGDDLTDECGFDIAHKLGGFGIIVGNHRLTKAGYKLDGVNAVMAWLRGDA